MRQIIYYVATSLDGYIAGVNDDISKFAQEGEGVRQYQQDLKSFDTVIMGRRTYEFGYQYGLKPGQPAYSHMRHYIFSNQLEFENQHEKVEVCKMDIEIIRGLKKEEGTDIYLCGGGQFAAWLLKHEMIDRLKIKLNPIVLNGGITLFSEIEKQFTSRFLHLQQFEDGLVILEYEIKY